MSFQISGIASGMDTQSMVDELMKAENLKLEKLEQEKQIELWRQDLYTNLNKQFANFILDTRKELGLTTTTSSGTMINKSVSSLEWVKIASSSNDSIASVSSNASSINGSFELNVDRLASGVTMASGSDLGSTDDTSSLSTQFGAIADSDLIDFTITNGSGDSVNISDSANNLTIDDIVDQINSADIGVTAVYDKEIDRFFIQTDNTGIDASIQITDNSSIDGATKDLMGDILQLNVTHYDVGNNKITESFTSGSTYSGVNAQIDFAGADNITQSSNNFSINGIDIDLKSVGTTTVKVDTDVDGVYKKIESYVESYNKLIEDVGEKLNEEVYRDYDPLTDEEKQAMTEKDVELWEQKAKSGLLRNDMYFTNTIQNVRNGLYESVTGLTGSFSHITGIGISTQKYSSVESGGKLEIDENKLKDAIREDVDGVLQLLFNDGDTKEEDGIITKTYDNMIEGMKEVINKAGPADDSSLYRKVKSNMLIDFVTDYSSISMIDDGLIELEEEIFDMNDYLVGVEDKYWSQFTAMEKAIQQMNSQSDWLAQQISQM